MDDKLPLQHLVLKGYYIFFVALTGFEPAASRKAFLRANRTALQRVFYLGLCVSSNFLKTAIISSLVLVGGFNTFCCFSQGNSIHLAAVIFLFLVSKLKAALKAINLVCSQPFLKSFSCFNLYPITTLLNSRGVKL